MKTIQIKSKIWCLSLCLLAAGLSSTFANNIQITGKPFMYNKNTSEGSVYISFPVQWENSWKVNKPNNWDAAWVFVKYREGGNAWQHVYIDTNSARHSCIAYDDGNSKINTILKVGPSKIKTINDTSVKGLGAFIYRAENGKGAIRFDSVNLKWNYRAQGLDDASVISLRVFAVEMVYIPQEPFMIGNTAFVNNSVRMQSDSGTVVKDWDITPPGPGTWNVFGQSAASIEGSELNSVSAWPGVSGQVLQPGAANGIWQLTKGTCGVKVYAEVTKHAWQSILYPFALSYNGSIQWSSAGYHSWNANGYGNSDGWHSFRVKMPSPYKASSMFFAWSNSYPIYGFFGRGSNDSVNWVNLTGSTSTSGSYAASTMYRMSIANPQAYTWYEFNYYTNTYLILAAWGLADETDGGDIANSWYYRGMGKPYAGKIPLSYTVNYNNIENTVDSNYPNGYKAFYIMKHELSQHAYVDFLNTLSESQQEYLVNTGKPSATNASSNPRTFDVSRNWIRLREKAAGSPAIYGCWVDGETQAPWAQESNAGNVAVNGLDWYANTAYLCWAGLRPLTELEYEKACRGTAPIVENEYAWGTSSTIPVTGVPSNINKSNELANPTNANYIPQAANFPLRVGALATASSTRTDAGASFYGVLNLSDNVSEIYINICTPQGRAYSGEHGSGVLNGNGEAEIEKWPNNNSAVGTGIRGIYRNGHADVANRTYIETKISRSDPATFGMNSYVGCRGGRTAPK